MEGGKEREKLPPKLTLQRGEKRSNTHNPIYQRKRKGSLRLPIEVRRSRPAAQLALPKRKKGKCAAPRGDLVGTRLSLRRKKRDRHIPVAQRLARPSRRTPTPRPPAGPSPQGKKRPPGPPSAFNPAKLTAKKKNQPCTGTGESLLVAAVPGTGKKRSPRLADVRGCWPPGSRK